MLKNINKGVDNIMEKNNNFRFRILGVFIMVLMFLLIGRVFFIEIIDGEQYKNMALRQQQYKINHMSSRGTIYDRNMVPLTNVENTTLLFVDHEIMGQEGKGELLDLAEEDSGILGENSGSRYKILKVNSRNAEVMSNFYDNYLRYPINIYKRYYENQPAAHLIGYVNEWNNKGAAGLEKSFETVLNCSKPEIYAKVDGVNNIIPGLGFQVEDMDENGNIVTTLDIELQKSVEQILKDQEKKSSVVILDTSNGELLACANYPSYNPNNISKYLDGQNEELINRAIQVGYPPGSIFKIIVASAALEADLVDEQTEFYCKGYEKINGIKIKCAAFSRGGHGNISFIEAFSKSCNAAFIQLGMMTGSDRILEMSKKFGLGDKTGIQVGEEYAGNLPSEEQVKGAGIGNLSVGQGELLITPLQAARITAVIANDGVDKGVRLIKEIQQDNSKVYQETASFKRVISKNTAEMIQSLMKETVKTGTANNLGRIYTWDASGKTGSAQSVYKNKEVVHAWFTGFIPSEEPQYVISVFVEDGKSGRQAAVPIFKEVAEFLYKNYH